MSNLTPSLAEETQVPAQPVPDLDTDSSAPSANTPAATDAPAAVSAERDGLLVRLHAARQKRPLVDLVDLFDHMKQHAPKEPPTAKARVMKRPAKNTFQAPKSASQPKGISAQDRLESPEHAIRMKEKHVNPDGTAVQLEVIVDLKAEGFRLLDGKLFCGRKFCRRSHYEKYWYSLCDESQSAQMHPAILNEEKSTIKAEIKGQYLSSIYDEASHHGHVWGNVLRWMDGDLDIQQRVAGLKQIAVAMNGNQQCQLFTKSNDAACSQAAVFRSVTR